MAKKSVNKKSKIAEKDMNINIAFNKGNNKEDCCDTKESCKCHHKGCFGGAIYGLGFVGAAIYYISTATGFWMGVLGVLKAIVWPVFLVFQAMKFLGM